MSKIAAFDEFRPSYLTAGFGWPPALLKAAFKDGSLKIKASLGGGGDTFTVEGVVGTGESHSFRFGHPKIGESGTGSDLSGSAPYRLMVEFDHDQIKQIVLTIYLLNVRTILFETSMPADFDRS